MVDDTRIKIVLTKNDRGWEMLGGHIDDGESIEDALIREAQEEGGFIPHQYKLFGYRKIIPKQPVANRTGGYYPFPVSYIPHYIATAEMPIVGTTGHEVIDSGLFSVAEVKKLGMPTEDVIGIGLEAYGGLYHP
ncbi:MAG TPA: NUDIX hydrolase [Bacillota bacterium]|nr:NUDIX hydrolase [Bacillota bacterium]